MQGAADRQCEGPPSQRPHQHQRSGRSLASFPSPRSRRSDGEPGADAGACRDLRDLLGSLFPSRCISLGGLPWGLGQPKVGAQAFTPEHLRGLSSEVGTEGSERPGATN